MSGRSTYDHEWADEVIRRWQRRRWRVQQRDRAVADLRRAISESWLWRTLARLAREAE